MASFTRLCLALATVLACDPPGEHEEPADTEAECIAAEATTARFTLELGGWTATGDELVITSACEVKAVAAAIELECEDADHIRDVVLTLSAAPAIAPPLRPGDSVTLAVRRKAEAGADRGFWAIRSDAGDLLLAGARSYASTPASDPEFFAPFTVEVDFTTCNEHKTDSCRLEQRVILALAHAAGTTRVPHGAAQGLPSGHRVLVERSMLTMSSGDPKVCPLDEATPETYQYLIVGPAE